MYLNTFLLFAKITFKCQYIFFKWRFCFLQKQILAKRVQCSEGLPPSAADRLRPVRILSWHRRHLGQTLASWHGASDFRASSRQIVALFETVQDPATASRNHAEAQIQATVRQAAAGTRQ